MKSRLPSWARIIVALVAATFVGSGYSVIRAVSMIQQMARDSTNPEKQWAIARNVADFPRPLPEGYVIDKAVTIAIPMVPKSGKDILVVKHVPDNLSIQLFSDPLAEQSDATDARNFLDRAIQVNSSGYPTPKIQAVKSKGQTTICGQEMAYIVGEFKDPQDRNSNGMIGCICVKDSHKTILIYALEPPGTAFNLETVMTLLKSVKSFKGN